MQFCKATESRHAGNTQLPQYLGTGQINNSLNLRFLNSKMGSLWGLFHSFFQQIFTEGLLLVRHHSGYRDAAMIKIGKKIPALLELQGLHITYLQEVTTLCSQ